VYEPLDVQFEELQKLLNPKVEVKPKQTKKLVVQEPVVQAPPAVIEAPKPKTKFVLEQPVEFAPPKPVVGAEPAVKKVNIPDGTDAVVASILEIYNSADSVEDKKSKLGKFKKPQLSSAWDIIKEQVPGMVNPTPLPANLPDFINCLANDPAHKCNKTKKKGGNDNGHNTTRKKI